ncbi:CRISPR-associated helicase Cas3' [Paenibacillus puerhi]|uniref:CRISPR-associated helicase Cas3' n=1 Tax=Paenibacillus puerhi TaxID=2692622 RepID=UPI00135AC2E1|nr:CRISPR-associated helicase Cas3' [Paenibacillus puerhi]
MDYIAHIRQRDGEIQTVPDHLQGVRQSSERHGAKIGVQHLAGLSGWLHDLGKYTLAFKSYIEEAVANPERAPRRGSVDHSTAGGRLLFSRYHERARAPGDRETAEWIANCIISHHQGLRDYFAPDMTSPFLDRVAGKVLEEYEQAVSEFFSYVAEEELDKYFAAARAELVQVFTQIREKGLPPITYTLTLKYVFSCLIDADRTNTREFEENEKSDPTLDRLAFFKRCYATLMHAMQELETVPDAGNPINKLRREMSRQCDEFALRPSGMYTLSIPTGGGKTLASLRYALKHATRYKKDRIIYIVPYTTVIEQNADEVRRILQEDDLILEHHSNVVDEAREGADQEEYDVRSKKLKLARDNWDSPIIFTTLVQFLNTFYAKGTRNIRRMHQLANAVLIFDEVQSVPVSCVSMFNAALNFLHVIGRSSIVLCTATQPALDYVKHQLHLSDQAEMIGNLDETVRKFKRVELIDQTTPQGMGADELSASIAERMESVRSVLVILNTKTAVRKLYNRLEKEEWVKGGVKLFHLSTGMCAAHRKTELDLVKEALKAEERVVCISTQLIEAGVNISFECVIRSLAGLDSIAQAAGRCNRHGKDPTRDVFIIKSADEVLTHLPEIRAGAGMTERVLHEFSQHPEQYGHDLLSADAMKLYFQYYYEHLKEKLHYWVPKLEQNMFDLLNKNKAYYDAYKAKHGKNKQPSLESRPALATAEQYFEVISSAARSVLVPYNDKARELILSLNGELDIRELEGRLKEAQPYMVNIFEHELRKLEKNGDVFPVLHGSVLALRETAYSDRFGLETNGEGEWQAAMC